MGEHDTSEVTAPCPLADFDDWALGKYRAKLEEALALDELPPLSEPREELLRQLAAVLLRDKRGITEGLSGRCPRRRPWWPARSGARYPRWAAPTRYQAAA